MNEISNNGSWNALPMSENVTALVYGVTYEDEDGEISVGPYLTDDNADAIIPEIENGYY